MQKLETCTLETVFSAILKIVLINTLILVVLFSVQHDTN
jgi:hypothetical protein